MAYYFKLDTDQVLQVAAALHRRVEERFPGSSLGNAAETIEDTVRRTRGRIRMLRRPHWPLRITSLSLLALTVLSLLYGLFGAVDWSSLRGGLSVEKFIGLLEPSLGSSVFVGAFFVFVWSIERRYKNRRVLEAISELRSLIHVIDMHQLTKDPERARHAGPNTASSPKRDLTVFELGRYLDYCSEMLSMISKVAALYAQAFPDPVVLTAADQVETLATGLSRKIWQKLVLLGDEVAAQSSAQPSGSSVPAS